MELSRHSNIQVFAGGGKLEELKLLFSQSFTQLEIDIALENAIAYSQIEVADYLLSLGGRFENYDYQGVFYAVHNNEFLGLKYAISKGVDININNGILLTTSILTAINSKDLTLIKWLLDNGADLKYLTPNDFVLIGKYGTDELKALIKKPTNASL